MSILGILIFSLCLCAIFSHKCRDGIIAKNLFAFAAITAFLVIVDPYNKIALYCSITFFVLAVGYWFFKNYQKIRDFVNFKL